MRTKPLQIGVTGGIGSGKSTVCHIFGVLGIECYNADNRAKWLMENDPDLIESIKTHFGQSSYIGGRINRDAIAKATFSNRAKLDQLNFLVHPKVSTDFQTWIIKQEGRTYVIKEAALLFESGSYKSLDGVINVAAPIELRIKRVAQRDPFRSDAEIRSIIDRQLGEEERNRLADYRIQNDESQSLINQVLTLHETFCSRGGSIHD